MVSLSLLILHLFFFFVLGGRVGLGGEGRGEDWTDSSVGVTLTGRYWDGRPAGAANSNIH